MPRKRNYLNNRDILTQIHLSKMTYCAFADPVTDNQQDFIVNDVSEINNEAIELAREARAKRLNRDVPAEDKIAASSIPNSDLVFRVTTTEHIPLVPKKKAVDGSMDEDFTRALDDLGFETLEEYNDDADDDDILVTMKTNFHPFFHYRIDETNTPYLVGKSHWKGDLDDGEFCQTHGKTTNELAKMYMKLCDRYATRSNWRGYTYNDEMRASALMQLIQVGLKFNEAKSDNPFAYYTAIVTNSFTRVLLNEKKMQNIRDDILEENGLAPSWTRQQQTANEEEDANSAKAYKQQKERAIKNAAELNDLHQRREQDLTSNPQEVD